MNETESLLARIASLEAELAGHHKRRAAIEAADAYKAHAAAHAQEIASEAASICQWIGAKPESVPFVSEFIRLRNEADRLRKEVQP
jgi:cell division septum initiation protein DivIVA